MLTPEQQLRGKIIELLLDSLNSKKQVEIKENYWCSNCLQVFSAEELIADPSPFFWIGEHLKIVTKNGIIEVENKNLLCPFCYNKTKKELEGTMWI